MASLREVFRRLPWPRCKGAKDKEAIRILKQRNAELEALHTITRIIAETPDLGTMLQAMLKTILDVTHTQAGGIWLLDHPRQQLELVHQEGYAGPLRERLQEIPLGQMLEGQVAKTGKARFIHDLRQEEGGRWFISPRYRSIATVPLLARGSIVGVLSIVGAKPGEVDENAFRLLQNIGAQVGLGIEKAVLYHQEREQRRLAEALAESAAIVGSSLELDEVLDRLLEQAARILPADALNIMLIEGDHVRPIRWRGYERFPCAEELPTLSLPLDIYPSWKLMIRSKQAIIIPNVPAEMWREAENWQWLHSYVGAPILIKDQVVGFFNIDGSRPYQFSEADALRLSIFARYAGTALEHARLYRELRTYADELERRVDERTRRLRERNARLQAIFNSTSEGMIVVEENRFECLNPVAERWLNRTLNPTDAESLRRAILAIARRSHEEATEGSEEITLGGIDFLLKARPIEGEKGTRLVTVQDITPWKAMARVHERFISTVSHELRTPITAIRLYAELLRNAPEERRQGYLEALFREIDHQTELIEGVLHLTRIDAGRQHLNFQPVEIVAQLQHLIEHHTMQMEEKGLRLENLLPDGTLTVLGQPEEMRLVFDNLLRNAIQYTPAGGTITITAREVTREGRQWAAVTIRDTGIGISAEDLPHIFKRFYRSQRAQRYFPHGTGLGLALVKEIVHLHGGMVEVQSEVEKGTAFTVYLPLALSADRRRLAKPAALSKGYGPQSPG